MKKNKDFKFEYKACDNGYKNPLSPDLNTADPCIIYSKKDECYYGIYTGGESLTLHRCKDFRDMFNNSESKVIYTSNEEDNTYGFLWAPELHCIDGVWYIYTSTKNKENNKKHLICLRAKSDNFFDGFELFSHISPELFAIDPTIYQKDNKVYMCFSQVTSSGGQELAICELENPGKIKGDCTIIAKAELDWELVEPYVGTWTIVEGAYFIEKGERLFIVYSANGCWSDDYVLGVLELTGDDILSADSWEKDSVPLMTKGNGNFGPGHATFFYSPSGEELWICHHCLHESDPEGKPMPRHCHCQKVYFDETGFPHTGLPVIKDKKLEIPI